MKLYLDPLSTSCRPITLFLADHDLAVERVSINLFEGDQHSPEFLALNPNGSVPVLVHDGLVLTESAAILKYLAELTRSSAYPTELRARASVNAWMDWFNTGLGADFAWGFVYPQVLREFHGFPDDRVQSAFVERGRERTARRMRVLDSQLGATDGAFVLGPTPTLADYQGACVASLGELIGFDYGPYSKVARWLRAMRARPSWDEINAAFYGWRSATLSRRAVSA